MEKPESKNAPRTQTIAFLAQKGGAGKSTLAVNLAEAALRAGAKVAILDADNQNTVSIWGRLRAVHHPTRRSPTIQSTTLNLVHADLQTLQNQDFDLILVDTPGHEGDFVGRVARMSDVILIPCNPALPDVHAVSSTMETAIAARTAALAVVNRAPRNTSDGGDYKARIQDRLQFPVAETIICNRVGFARAFEEGLSLEEARPNDRGCAEIAGLYREVTKLLSRLSVKRQKAEAEAG